MNELRALRLRKAIRSTVVGIGLLALAAMAFGMLPGHEIYVDGVLVERSAAGSGGFLPFVWWLVAPGLVVWLHPRTSLALAWSLLAWLGVLMLVVAGPRLDDVGRHVVLWPTIALELLLAPILFTLLLAMPFGLAIHDALARRADARAALLASPPMPTARVVRERR